MRIREETRGNEKIRKEIEELSPKEIMKRYPHITAPIIAVSPGYATPSCVATILKYAREDRKNYCEWIYSCYTSYPRKAVRDSIRNRHYHKGFMSDYKLALKLVNRAIETGQEPLFGSWF